MYCNSDLLYRFLDFLTMHCNEALAPKQMWSAQKSTSQLVAQVKSLSLLGGEFQFGS